jgi:CRISPR/Cas system CMR-associated protein Cmr5 small subunit
VNIVPSMLMNLQRNSALNSEIRIKEISENLIYFSRFVILTLRLLSTPRSSKKRGYLYEYLESIITHRGVFATISIIASENDPVEKASLLSLLKDLTQQICVKTSYISNEGERKEEDRTIKVSFLAN